MRKLDHVERSLRETHVEREVKVKLKVNERSSRHPLSRADGLGLGLLLVPRRLRGLRLPPFTFLLLLSTRHTRTVAPGRAQGPVPVSSPGAHASARGCAQNAYVETFGLPLHDELVSVELFWCLVEQKA
jgi:hypothetical protein